MRPLRLVMHAFGPFRGRQEIDFAALGDNRLFLIEGDTGSGKTTIFDAMCAALYGETSVGRSQGHMKCLSADPDTLCRLEFAFQVGPRSFRVERVPEQERPARRGDRMTKQEHTATLWETTDGSDHVLATKLRDVSDRVVEILGLNVEQFCQVVLLPQGRFEKLLKAPAQDRERVMQVLFQTDRYLDIQNRLAANARQADAEVKDALHARELTLAAVGCSTPEDLTKRQTDAQDEIAAAKDARAALGTDEAAARAALDSGREVARKIAEQGAAELAFSNLQEREPEVKDRRLEIARAERAFHIEATDANLVEAEKQAHEATEDLIGKKLLLDGARVAKLRAAHDLDAQEKRRPEHEGVRAEIARLETIEKVVAELAGLRTDVATARTEKDIRSSRLKAAEEELAACSEKFEVAKKRHAEQELVASTVADRRKSVKTAEVAQERSKLADQARAKQRELAKEATAARKRQQAAEEAMKKARTEFAKAQTAWTKAQAAVLAKTLEAESPCPVCGSKHHPKPAKHARGEVDQETLESKQAAASEAEDALEAVRAELSELEKALSDAEGRAEALTDDAGTTAETAAHDAGQSRKLLDKAESAAKALPALAGDIAKLEKDNQRRKQECAALLASVREIEAKLTTAVAKLEQREQDIPVPHRDPVALHGRLEATGGQLLALTRALDKAQEAARIAGENEAKYGEAVAGAQEAAEKTATQTMLLAEQLTRKIADEGFNSIDDYRAARRERSQFKELQAKVARFDEDLAAARARRDRAVEAAAGLAVPDLATIEARVQELLAQLQAADTQIGALDKDIATMEAARKRLAELQKDLAGREGRAATLRRLADVATGAAPRNPGFHRFVLAERLDEVLLAANRRLGPMSESRYRLQRVLEEENQRIAAGLNLEVLDGHSGKTRPVDTLSGGESFLAALSLALGLADVVQQHAGGVKLDTVFVDEGFGSLDPNALELAMQCLEDLRQTGRLVGVISHVAEMKERIRNAQLRVTNVHGVSEARFVVV